MRTSSAESRRGGRARRTGSALSAVALAAVLAWGAATDAAPGAGEPEARPLQIDDRLASPRLWRIEASAPGPNGERGSLSLLGSIHVGPPEGWMLSPQVEQAFAAAEVLVVEVDLEARSAEERDDTTLSYGLLATDESLSERISPELYAALRARLKEYDRPIMALDRLEPWMVAIMLTATEIELAGYSPESGVELQLLRRARGSKEIVGLETAREQLSLLDGLSPELQSLMLKDVLLHDEDLRGYFDQLMEAWRSGDDPALEKLVFRELAADPELVPFYEAVIFERNARMAERLAELLRSGRQLFGVIGAAHLAGERGIPARLRDLGLKVRVVPASQPR